MTTSAFGVEHEVAKAYTAGTITYHNENARMHSRKKNSGYRQAGAGVVVAGGSVAAHQNAEVLGHKAAEMTRRSDELRSVTVIRGARTAMKVKRASRYGIAGGAALAGVGAARAVYHGHKQNTETKRAQGARVQRSAELEQRQHDEVEAAMSGRLHKSAFGVDDEISKLGPPRVHYQETSVSREKKGGRTLIFSPDTIESQHKGKTLILRRPKYEAHGHNSSWKPKNGDLVAQSPRYKVHRDDARRIHQAHQDDAETITLAGGHTMKHRKVSKSAFGVEHEPVEKFALGSILEAGRDALKGVKAGFGGWHESGGKAVKLGQQTGSAALKTGNKLKPLVNTPGKKLAVGAGAAGAGGFALGHQNDN